MKIITCTMALRKVILLLTLSPLSHSLSTPFGNTAKNVATQVLQGAGPAIVDLNKYNLKSLEEIEREWTANLVQKSTEREAKVALGVRTAQELFVDTVQVTYPRRPDSPGLGLELVELAGGREDGLGITMISGAVEGSEASGVDIQAGDSLATVAVVRRRREGVAERGVADTQQEFAAQTECLSYDATVAAIQSLPAISKVHDDTFVLTIKRIRKKPKVRVKLQYPPSQNEPDEILELFAGENLRHGMLVRGVKLNDPLAQRFDTKNGGNCGAGGLCRTCSVSVIKGGDLLNPQRVAEKQMLQDNPRWRLACKAIVGFGMREGDMTIRVNPRQW